VDCQKPWTLVMNYDILWTYYLDVALLLFFYFVLAMEIRHRLDPVSHLVRELISRLILIFLFNVLH